MPNTSELTPVLYIFAGLPGSGKTTLARMLSRHLRACYLRADTIEQALRDICQLTVSSEGYQLAYRIAADNLRIGHSVVADSCNPITLTRQAWWNVAAACEARHLDIEVTCSDVKAHQRRVATRVNDIEGLRQPDWQAVQDREYHSWQSQRLIIDTAGQSPEQSFADLLAKLPAALPGFS